MRLLVDVDEYSCIFVVGLSCFVFNVHVEIELALVLGVVEFGALTSYDFAAVLASSRDHHG